MTENWKALLLSTSLLATPLTLAAVGECINERAGLFNIGLEGIFFLSVVIGVRGAEIIGSGVAGLLVGLLTGALIGFIFSVLAVYLRANQLVLGMGINIFAMGMLAYLLAAIWAFPGIHSVRPEFHISKMLGYFTPIFFVAVIAAILAHIIIHRTLFGIRIRAAGEKPEAVDVAGVRVDRIRILACTVGAALAGLGGAFFALGWFGEIVKEMAVGMGFIALAVVVVAGLEPLLALAIAFVFGFVRALADWVATMPGINVVLPGAFYIMNMVPFLVTLLVVTIFIGRRKFPRALGKPYVRE
ncbi:MAG: ABC transporter permease [Hadesarchaea archaeon]|nr:ABC transporter permease [Hadesarchaea archaeon]